MATAITKVLNGVVTLAPLANQIYDFVVPNPNTLSTEVLSEVYIQCDTTLGKITINLPNIASIGTYNPKVYVSDTAFSATASNIIIVADPGAVGPPVVAANTVNAVAQVLITVDGTSTMLAIVSDTQWLAV
jgi:hypothetical protein